MSHDENASRNGSVETCDCLSEAMIERVEELERDALVAYYNDMIEYEVFERIVGEDRAETAKASLSFLEGRANRIQRMADQLDRCSDNEIEEVFEPEEVLEDSGNTSE